MGEQAKVVCLRLGQDFDCDCMQMDQVIASTIDAVQSHCSIYAVDVREVPECVQEFNLAGQSLALVFFFKGKPLRIDVGKGNLQTAITWAIEDRQEFVDLVEAVCRGAQQGRDFIVAPRDYSVQMRY